MNDLINPLQTAADNIIGMLWNLMEAGLEELKLLQTAIILITTNSVVQHDSLAKVRLNRQTDRQTQTDRHHSHPHQL